MTPSTSPRGTSRGTSCSAPNCSRSVRLSGGFREWGICSASVMWCSSRWRMVYAFPRLLTSIIASDDIGEPAFHVGERRGTDDEEHQRHRDRPDRRERVERADVEERPPEAFEDPGER